MKRFTILFTTLVSVLVFSAVFQAWSDARAEEKEASAPVQVYDSTGAMLEAQNKPVVVYGNALELQYAQPWLDKANLPIAVTGAAQEQISLICSSSTDMFYVCKYGYDLP